MELLEHMLLAKVSRIKNVGSVLGAIKINKGTLQDGTVDAYGSGLGAAITGPTTNSMCFLSLPVTCQTAAAERSHDVKRSLTVANPMELCSS